MRFYNSDRRVAVRPLRLILAAATVGCFSAGHALAQTATSRSAAADVPPTQVGEIVVTANKRSENIQKVPIAISAVTSERLTSSNIVNAENLGEMVSGLQIELSNQPHLRGIGTTQVGVGTENSVATYIDGVYIMALYGTLVTLGNDISQIEVLKGPQGTLFGRNATGGVINIATRDPLQAPSGDFTAMYGNYQTGTMEGYLTGGITENLSANIGVFASYQGEGWGKDIATGGDVNRTNQYAARSKWLFEPTHDDQFRFIADFEKLSSNQMFDVTQLPGTTANYGPGTATAAQRLDLKTYVDGGAVAPFAVVGEPYTSKAGFYDSTVFPPPFTKFQTEGVSLQWDHEFGDSMKFTSITAYRFANTRQAESLIPEVADLQELAYTEKEDQLSEELRLASGPSSRVQWTVGLYYLSGSDGYYPATITGTVIAPLQAVIVPVRQTTQSEAAFGQFTVPLWSGAHFTGGLRYTSEERAIDEVEDVVLLPAFGGGTAVAAAIKAHHTFDAWTWRLALDQQLTPELLAYVSYNRGFQSGQYAALPASSTPVQPEILDAYETGFKSELLDKHFRLNMSAFYYNYTNLQVNTLSKLNTLGLANAAAAITYGADVDLEAKIGSHLTLTGGATLMHSSFTDYKNAPFYVPQPASAGGGTIQENKSAKGNEIPFTPNFTANLGADYIVPIGDGKATFFLNYSYNSGWFASADNILKQSAYSLLDGSVTYTFPGNRIQLGLWAHNITATKYYVGLASGANPGGYQAGLVGAPATYGAMIGYKF